MKKICFLLLLFLPRVSFSQDKITYKYEDEFGLIKLQLDYTNNELFYFFKSPTVPSGVCSFIEKGRSIMIISCTREGAMEGVKFRFKKNKQLLVVKNLHGNESTRKKDILKRE